MSVLQTVQQKQAQQHKAQQELAARQLAERAPVKKLALQLLAKGWRIGRPQVSVGALSAVSASLPLRSIVHWGGDRALPSSSLGLCLCQLAAAATTQTSLPMKLPQSAALRPQNTHWSATGSCTEQSAVCRRSQAFHG